jgi:two-component system, NtrC family, sensor kinase
MAVDNKTSLYGLAWLENTDWMMVIKEDPAEELKPLFYAEQLLWIILTGGILVICIGAIFVTNKMIGRLVASEREKGLLDASLMQSSKMAALGKLAAGVAHEINNPLAIIKEKAGWLRDLLSEEDVAGSPNFKEFEDSIGKIEYHVERAKTVTHRMLGFARKMEPVDEVLDLNQLLDQTLTFLKTEAMHRSIKLETDFDPELPKTRSDSAQLQQVFLNILDNAIDATGKNGVITVGTSHAEAQKSILVIIRDTGSGISPDKLEHIFDPFFTTKKPGEGTGLGLSISYNIIEKLGGKIAVESKVGKGTAFSIILPVRD